MYSLALSLVFSGLWQTADAGHRCSPVHSPDQWLSTFVCRPEGSAAERVQTRSEFINPAKNFIKFPERKMCACKGVATQRLKIHGHNKQTKIGRSSTAEMIIVWWALHLLSCKTLINLHSCKRLRKEQSHEKADPKRFKDLSFLTVPIPKTYDLWTHTQKKNPTSLDHHLGFCRRNYCTWRSIRNPSSLDIELWALQGANLRIKGSPGE